MKLIIDRNLWLRGVGSSLSKLLRSSDGKMCCLGFYGLACGLSSEDIRNQTIPGNVDYAHKAWGEQGEWLLDDDMHNRTSIDCTRLITINDSPYFSTSEREKRLRKSLPSTA
jgi:hypothetical protein